ncbi:hypothetical protein [Brevibacterium atlanticum]|uniref:hypothetical protein n=1 Tax=Brevibacterium atlanticum TaxID=2697563 RepID=UPI0014210E7B|nr:hypothetical protein [Brevibacterium atlanticum]
MSVTPNETTGTAHEAAPPAAPTAMGSTSMSITVVAFVVFIAAWIGAKAVALTAPTRLTGLSGVSDFDLLRLVLFVIAGAAAVVVGRQLRSIQRSVFIVITVLYFVFAGLGSIFASDGFEGDVPFLTALTAIVFVADLAYPLIVAQVLAVTVSRVAPVPDAASDEADSTVASDEREGAADPDLDADTDAATPTTAAGAELDARARRHGKTAATFLFITAAMTIVVWLVRTVPLFPPYWQFIDWVMASGLWTWMDALNAIAAAVGSVAAVFALRAVAESRTLPTPDPVVGPWPKQTRPKLAHTLTFLTVAGGLYFCLTSTSIVIGFAFGTDGGYPAWALGMILFTLGAIVLAIVTLDAVTRRRRDSEPGRSDTEAAVEDSTAD